MINDIFFYEAFEEETEALKRFLPDNISAGFSWKTIQEAGHSQPPAKIVSLRTQSALPVSWAGALDAIITRSTGYDHIRDYLDETSARIPCGYLPLYCNRAVAEHALMLWLALMRKLPAQIEQFQTFHRDGITGQESEGKILTVVGVGNIGHEVVTIGRGLGMDVLGVDIVERHDNVEYVSPEEGLKRADVIVCAMNLTPENADYFDYETLKRTKRGVIFVNIARGEFSPARDLLKLVDEGHLGGVGLDVYNHEKKLAVALRGRRIENAKEEDEEIRAIISLAQKPNIIMTPHNAFNTKESVEKKSRQTVEQLVQFLETGEFKWAVRRN